MPKVIELPNGEVAEFPDRMTDEDISSVLRKQFSKQPQTPALPPLPAGMEQLGRPPGAAVVDPKRIPMEEANSSVFGLPSIEGFKRFAERAKQNIGSFVSSAGNVAAGEPVPGMLPPGATTADLEAYGQAAKRPMLPVSEIFDPGTFSHGAAKAAENLTSPASAAEIAGLTAAQAIPGVNVALNSYLAYQAGSAAGGAGYKALEHYRRGDLNQTAEALGMGTFDTLMAALMIHAAAKGATNTIDQIKPYFEEVGKKRAETAVKDARAKLGDIFKDESAPEPGGGPAPADSPGGTSPSALGAPTGPVIETRPGLESVPQVAPKAELRPEANLLDFIVEQMEKRTSEEAGARVLEAAASEGEPGGSSPPAPEPRSPERSAADASLLEQVIKDRSPEGESDASSMPPRDTVAMDRPEVQPLPVSAGGSDAEAPVRAGVEHGLPEVPPGDGTPPAAASQAQAKGIVDLPVDQISVDPARFQFKENTGGKSGTGDEMKDVDRYDPELAGVVSVWRDPEDGKTYIVNGHHRLDLAKRAGEPTIRAQEIQADTANAARAKGALINIAEGKGTPIDAAKFFRDSNLEPDDLVKKGISLRGQVARDGVNLARLAPPIFDRVVSGELPVPKASIIGELLPEHSDQKAVMALLDRRQASGKNLTNDELRELVRFAQGAPRTTETTANLFGEETIERNHAVEMAELSANVKQRLAVEKKLFSTVGTSGAAEKLGEHGNVVATDKNRAIAEQLAQAQAVYDKLSTRTGPIYDALEQGAKDLASGGNPNEVREQTYGRVRNAIAKELGLPTPAADAGGATGRAERPGKPAVEPGGGGELRSGNEPAAARPGTGEKAAEPTAESTGTAKPVATPKEKVASGAEVKPESKPEPAAATPSKDSSAKPSNEEPKSVVTPGSESKEAASTVPTASPETPESFPETPETGLAVLVQRLHAFINKRIPMDNRALWRIADEAMGGTRAEGAYTARDAYDALEAAVNRWLAENLPSLLADAPSVALERLRSMMTLLPTQTDRDETQKQLQQFSTPPTLALVAATALRATSADIVLEPSAGVGGLATFARAAGATVQTNEIDPRRRALLELNGFTPTDLNAEQIANLMAKSGEPRPTAVLMNPPFSATGGRLQTNNNEHGYRHVRQALARLRPGGRAVIILGEGSGLDKPAARKFWVDLMREHTVRMAVGLPGSEYRKYGTTFGNVLIVLDKSGPQPGEGWDEKTASIIKGEKTLEEALAYAASGTLDRVPTEPAPPVPGNLGRPSGNTGPGARHQPENAGERSGSRGSQSRPAPAPTAKNEPSEGPRDVPRNEPQAPAGPTRQPQPGRGSEGRGANDVDERVVSVELGAPLSEDAPRARRQDEAGGTFTSYAPAKIRHPKKHPGRIVETSSMAAVEPPDPTHSPKLRRAALEYLSDVQLESVIYAGQRHSQTLPDGSRAGFMIGDGTGVGKGSQLAGVVQDNWQQGRRRVVWVSASADLVKDAQRDFRDTGAEDIADKAKLVNDWKPAEAIDLAEGVIFTTYTSLPNRREQLEKWLGEDGVLLFDEAHKAKNAQGGGDAGQERQQGQGEPFAAHGLYVLSLVRRLKQAAGQRCGRRSGPRRVLDPAPLPAPFPRGPRGSSTAPRPVATP